MSETAEQRWDAGSSDPIADIRRAFEVSKRNVAAEARMVAFHNARLSALSHLARDRAATLTEEQRGAPVPEDRVPLCDEHGPLPQVTISPWNEQIVTPMHVPRAIAEMLGAEIRDNAAHLRLGVLAP